MEHLICILSLIKKTISKEKPLKELEGIWWNIQSVPKSFGEILLQNDENAVKKHQKRERFTIYGPKLTSEAVTIHEHSFTTGSKGLQKNLPRAGFLRFRKKVGRQALIEWLTVARPMTRNDLALRHLLTSHIPHRSKRNDGAAMIFGQEAEILSRTQNFRPNFRQRFRRGTSRNFVEEKWISSPPYKTVPRALVAIIIRLIHSQYHRIPAKNRTCIIEKFYDFDRLH